MVVAPNPSLQEVVSRLMDIERRMDRLAAARVLSAPVGTADIGNKQVAYTKLLGSGVANTVAQTANGSDVVYGQVTNSLMATNAINTANIIAGSVSNYSLRPISTGPYFATGGSDNLVYSGGISPSITASATTQYIVVGCTVRFHMNAQVHVAGQVGANGIVYAETGVWTPAVGTYCTLTGLVIATASPSTAYSVNIWLVTAAGMLVTLDAGFGWILELKR